MVNFNRMSVAGLVATAQEIEDVILRDDLLVPARDGIILVLLEDAERHIRIIRNSLPTY